MNIKLIDSLYSTAYKSYCSHNTPFEDGDTHKSLVLSNNLFRRVTSVQVVGPRHCCIGKADLRGEGNERRLAGGNTTPSSYELSQNCWWEWGQERLPPEPGESVDRAVCYWRSWSVTIVVRLIYGRNIMFEVKWPEIVYNHIRCWLEALINSVPDRSLWTKGFISHPTSLCKCPTSPSISSLHSQVLYWKIEMGNLPSMPGFFISL